MGWFSKLFGSIANTADAGFGPDFASRANAIDKRVNRIRSMDADALRSLCVEETEIWTALLCYSELVTKHTETFDNETLVRVWNELAQLDPPAFDTERCRFDPEVYFAVREYLEGHALYQAASNIDHLQLHDYLLCAGDEDYFLHIEPFLTLGGDRQRLKGLLFSRLEHAPEDEYSIVPADELWRLMEEQDDQPAISRDILQYVRVVGDREEYLAKGLLGKLSDHRRASCTASWFRQEAAPQLWSALIHQSAAVDDYDSVVSTSVNYMDRVLMDVSAAPQALQAGVDFGNLTRYESEVGVMTMRGVMPDPIMASDRKWYENLKPSQEMGTGDEHSVFVAGKTLIEYLSKDWEECRYGLVFPIVPTDPYFAILLKCLGRENPQVRLNAIRVLIELAMAGLFAPTDPGTTNRYDLFDNATAERVEGPLANLATNGQTEIRRAALYAARLFPSPKLANAVAASLSWTDIIGSAFAVETAARWIVAGRAEFHNADVLEALVDALANWEAGPHALDALLAMGWEPHNDRERIRHAGARRSRQDLEADRALTDAVLLHDLHDRTYAPVQSAVWLFVGLGDPNIIPQLVSALRASGTKVMAEAFLNCGNQDLYDAASDWASRRGYEIESSSGAHPIGWGAL